MGRDYNLIAVGVDRDGNVFKAHFGMAHKYLIFDSNLDLKREVENPYAVKTTHHDDPGLITSLLSDVGVFIAHRMGKVSRQRLHDEFHVKSFLTEEKNPLNAVREFLNSKTD